MKIQSIFENGDEGSLARRFYVATTTPFIEAEVLDRESNSNETTIRLTLSDNPGYITLFEGDNQIFKCEGNLVISGQIEKVFDYKVTLVVGENIFEFILKDGVGHERRNYRSHVQDIGWQSAEMDGQITGTKGKSLRLKGMNIEIVG